MNTVISWIVSWLAANLTEEFMKEWAAKLIPIIKERKIEIFERLREAAADTETPLDDVAVDAAEAFVDGLLPTLSD